MGSTSCPSGMTERFILAMRSRVSSAACVFPVETLKRADSGINWAQSTGTVRTAGTVLPKVPLLLLHALLSPRCLPHPGGVASSEGTLRIGHADKCNADLEICLEGGKAREQESLD